MQGKLHHLQIYNTHGPYLAKKKAIFTLSTYLHVFAKLLYNVCDDQYMIL